MVPVAATGSPTRVAWSAVAGGATSAAVDMRMLVHQVQLAAFQVISAGTEDQVTAARKVLTQTRRALYRILAEDDQTEGDSGAVNDAQPVD
jgi:hypothetical protein